MTGNGSSGDQELNLYSFCCVVDPHTGYVTHIFLEQPDTGEHLFHTPVTPNSWTIDNVAELIDILLPL